MSDTAEIVWQGKYIVAKREGRWEYVSRAKAHDAAIILAIDDGHVLLVEQWRVPLHARALEMPAGLVGDETEGEDVLVAAARELEEETGYRPARCELIGRFCSSGGMVSETFSLVRAHDLEKVGDGGGIVGEDITVHRVALDEVASFVASKRKEGVVIDARLLLLLAGSIL